MEYDKKLVDLVNKHQARETSETQLFSKYIEMIDDMSEHAGEEAYLNYCYARGSLIKPVFVVEPDNNEAIRFNTGKTELSYLLDAPVAVKGLCEVFAMGAEKYARYNWKKGLNKDQIIDSLLRHLLAYKSGELVDSESGKCHSFHVLWNALVLAEQHSNK